MKEIIFIIMAILFVQVCSKHEQHQKNFLNDTATQSDYKYEIKIDTTNKY